MNFEWHAGKARTNKAKHKVSFDIAPAYGEERLVATGWVGTEMYTMVYVEHGDVVRVISLRKATRKERETYAENC